MHPLRESIHKAVGQFTDNHQSLSMLMVNTLVAIIEMEVGPVLAAAKTEADGLRFQLADELNGGLAMKAERDHWKARAEAFLDFDRLKPVLIGEFKVEHFGGVHPETGEDIDAETMIPWTTIKDILKAAALPSSNRTVPLVGGIDKAQEGADRTAVVGLEETPDGQVYHLLGGYDIASKSFACSCGQRHAEVDIAGGKL